MVIDFLPNEHKYLIDGEEKPSVTQITDYITFRHYKKINTLLAEQAIRRGNLVHETTELIDYGYSAEFPYEISGYIKAYNIFLRDYKPAWEYIEHIVYDKTRGVCGRLDRLGIIDGKHCIVDIKTNSNPTRENYLSVCLQTAEYKEAVGIKDAKRYALYLKKNGDYRFFNCTEYEKKLGFSGIELFDACLNLHNQTERILKHG